MTQLYIPACGDELVLDRAWTFTLYDESRNDSLLKSVLSATELQRLRQEAFQRALENRKKGIYDFKSEHIAPVEVTLEQGTALKIDRVYIRAHSKQAETSEDDYDSITFRISLGKHKGSRFWVKLADANRIEYCHTASYKETKKKAKLKTDKIKRLIKQDPTGTYGGWVNATTPEDDELIVKTFRSVLKDHIPDGNPKKRQLVNEYPSYERIVYNVLNAYSTTIRLIESREDEGGARTRTFKISDYYDYRHDDPNKRASRRLYVPKMIDTKINVIVTSNADDTEIASVRFTSSA